MRKQHWQRHAGRLLHIASLASDWRRAYLSTTRCESLNEETDRLGCALLESIEALSDLRETKERLDT